MLRSRTRKFKAEPVKQLVTRKNVVLNRRIINQSKSGVIHLAITSMSRFSELNRIFPSIRAAGMQRGTIFCECDSAESWLRTSSKKKYTESPDVATCEYCIGAARDWGYRNGSSNNNKSHLNKFLLSDKTISNITNWIPESCNINISSKGIVLVDELTGEQLSQISIQRAAMAAVEKCFKPLSSDFIAKNEGYLSKEILDTKNISYTIQGLSFDRDLKVFNGLILKSFKDSELYTVTFEELLQLGYHLKDGSPCGDYVKDRKKIVDSEVDEDLGIDMIDLV